MCKNSTPYRVGDIVYYMYNFSGLFPVFFEVTGLTKCCIKVRPLKNKYINIGAGFGTFDAVPDTWSALGEPSKLINIRPDGFGYAGYYNYRFALRHWDGKPISGYSA